MVLFKMTLKQKFLKKYIKIDDPLDYLSERIRNDFFEGKRPLKDFFIQVAGRFGFSEGGRLKKTVIIVIMISFYIQVKAPETNSLNIVSDAGIKPFTVLMDAIAMVETMGNNLAYNELENAAGKLQIRQVRLDEYNRRTGGRFKLTDMFDPVNSEKVFLYFASVAGPYRFERIAKRWNGSGPKTELYWERVKRRL
jgi:hypothetical protein